MAKLVDVASGMWSNGVSWKIIRVDISLSRFGDRWTCYDLYVKGLYKARANDMQSLFDELKRLLK